MQHSLEFTVSHMAQAAACSPVEVPFLKETLRVAPFVSTLFYHRRVSVIYTHPSLYGTSYNYGVYLTNMEGCL